MALAAPVLFGTMLAAAARARRRSPFGWGASWVFWSLVYAWMVVMRPETMPYFSSSTWAIGARQLVVQDAQLMMVSLPSRILWLTLKTIVLRSPVAGAEMTTRLAPAFR